MNEWAKALNVNFIMIYIHMKVSRLEIGRKRNPLAIKRFNLFFNWIEKEKTSWLWKKVGKKLFVKIILCLIVYAIEVTRKTFLFPSHSFPTFLGFSENILYHAIMQGCLGYKFLDLNGKQKSYTEIYISILCSFFFNAKLLK